MRDKLGAFFFLAFLIIFSLATCSSMKEPVPRGRGGQSGARLQSFIASLEQSKDPEAKLLARKVKFFGKELRQDGKSLAPLQPYLVEMERSAEAGNYDAAERALMDAVGQAYDAVFWKEVSFPSTDGFQVYAYLTEPKGESKFPIVVLVHGGEHGSASSYQRHAFLFLNQNFATLAVDYRGSSRHGESYKDAADPAGKEIDDVLKAVQYASNLPTTSAVGLMGSSHGAFISGNVLTRTSLVNAATLNFGGYNFQTLFEEWQKSNSPVAQKKVEIWGPVVQSEGSAEARALSPIYNTDKINTPLLLIHGKQDQVIPYQESVNFYDELKKHGKTVTLKLYPNGPHGFIFQTDQESESALETTESFFKKYLK